MKKIEIIPTKLEGKVNTPPSKSMSHRAIICGGLAEGVSNIDNLILSDDIKATIDGMRALGSHIECFESKLCKGRYTVTINGDESIKSKKNTIDCKESGSTLRFLIPLACYTGEKIKFTGRGKLVERPLNTYYEIFDEQSVDYQNNDGNLPLEIKGIIKPDVFRIKGNISSQFITGLMFLLPLLNGDSKIEITTELESKGYVDLTTDMLNKFGIEIKEREYKEFFIKGNQKYKSRDYIVEGDYSQAAFWIVAGLLGGNISCKNISKDSLQGDRAIVDIVKEMGGKIEIGQDHIEISCSHTHGTIIDASQCPDLVPILAVLGSLSRGITKIVNAERLRIKESDRLKAISTELNKLGANITELKDGLIIEGKESLKGGIVDSWNDHRIAMALAIASIRCTEPVIITGSDAVKKSYPQFWEDFKKLGGKINEWDMG